jgi:hypothetical protein
MTLKFKIKIVSKTSNMFIFLKEGFIYPKFFTANKFKGCLRLQLKFIKNVPMISDFFESLFFLKFNIFIFERIKGFHLRIN